MERSQHIAWRRMRVTPYSLILGLALFIMAGWAGFSCSQRNGGIRSSKRVQLHLVRLPLLSVFSIYAADTGPNKNHQGGREWGLIVFCRYRGQYQQHALWSPHRDSICWVKSVGLRMLVCTVDWKRAPEQHAVPRLPAEPASKPRNHTVTWPNEALNF